MQAESRNDLGYELENKMLTIFRGKLMTSKSLRVIYNSSIFGIQSTYLVLEHVYF